MGINRRPPAQRGTPDATNGANCFKIGQTEITMQQLPAWIYVETFSLIVGRGYGIIQA